MGFSPEFEEKIQNKKKSPFGILGANINLAN